MAHSSNTTTSSSQQHYSSSLAAYTLKQLSAAHAALDNDEQATAKLPATVKMYGHHVSKRSTGARNHSTFCDPKQTKLPQKRLLNLPHRSVPAPSNQPKLDSLRILSIPHIRRDDPSLSGI
ncbi:hypothetical protein H2248_004518 [Termitomyces sp. 'cryptogamus']|nr:hypothetical protein H2248_004518 [Termitomyces sp. 'cryptogamus']